MKILVSGGLGFIGSHTVVELQDEGYEVVIVDNLSNSTLEVLEGIKKISAKAPIFENIDLRNKEDVRNLFKKHRDIKGIIHFAASKAVGESVRAPLHYYENNLNTLIYTLQSILELKSQNFIFSSSCTVYGQAEQMPITEDAPVQLAQSPYGNTKQIGEEIIIDSCKAHSSLKAISLRYFNPVGAHHTAEIGELPLGTPENLVPFITQSVAGVRGSLSVFGNDYPTPDGTCIRDYIHVVDLAKAHVLALKRLIENKGKENYEVFNIGTGKGSSVLEVIQAFEKATGESVDFKFAPRRPGDVPAAYADTKKSETILGWTPKYSLEDAMKSAWQWEKKIRNI